MKKDDDTRFGAMLREFRHRRNMSQTMLAAKVGVSLNTIYCWENKRSRPGIGALVRLADYLDMPLPQIMDLLEEDRTDDRSDDNNCTVNTDDTAEDMKNTGGRKMRKPVLIIMAAGMGSRYGGLKQADPVDEHGHVIMDFSVFDAVRAGFEEVIFVIKRENEEMFRQQIGDRIGKYVDVRYVFQEMENVPDWFAVTEGRVKPWGTAHAVLSCKDVVDGPLAVINADDYYGTHAFSLIYDYLSGHEDDDLYRYMMVGFRLGNTLTESGHVSRGVCEVDQKGNLISICERVHIEKRGEGAAFSEDGGETFTSISPDETVSMNLWGFTASFMKELADGFEVFLREQVPANPMKAEYFLPSVVGKLIEEGKAGVKVLRSPDKWYGMTYQEDKAAVQAALAGLKKEGVYPEILWG